MSVGQIILRGTLLAVLLVLMATLLGDLLDRQWIDSHVRGQGFAGYLAFFAAACLLMALGLSRQLIAFLAGYGFGFESGFLVAMLAVTCACMLTFTVSRLLLRRFLLQHYSRRIERVEHFISAHTFTVTLLFRLLPMGSNWLVNVAAGAAKIRSVPFFFGSMLGYIPQMVVFSLAGSGAQLGKTWQVGIALALLVVAAVLGYWLYHRYRTAGMIDRTEPLAE